MKKFNPTLPEARALIWENTYGDPYFCFPCDDGSAMYIGPNGSAGKATRTWRALLDNATEVFYEGDTTTVQF